MKNKLVFMAGILLTFGLAFAACENDTTNSDTTNSDTTSDLKYSIQVNKQGAVPVDNQRPVQANNQLAAARSIAAEDTVELYIHQFEYEEDEYNRGLIIIAEGNRDMGSKGGILNNAGWFSVDEVDLPVSNDVNPGPYSSFGIRISKLKVNGKEYEFPDEGRNPDGSSEVIFGTVGPRLPWGDTHSSPERTSDYPDNFSGITITDSTTELKTVLTVDPDIIDTDGNLVSDPYNFIKVKGIVTDPIVTELSE
jgi:hypothetical protein